MGIGRGRKDESSSHTMHTYKRQIFLVYVNGGIFDREFGAFFST